MLKNCGNHCLLEINQSRQTICHDKKCTFAVCGVWIICLISFKCLVEHNRYLETLTQE